MRPHKRYARLPREFWAAVKLISQILGYSQRGDKRLRRYGLGEIIQCVNEADLSSDYLIERSSEPSDDARMLLDYLNYRADVLEKSVEPNLMDRSQARAEFERLRRQLRPTCALPLNKQKGKKRHPLYLTGIVNMLTEATLGGCCFEDEPRRLIVVTKDRRPLRTLSRWMDGAYPTAVDPLAVWETKEYYGTTTFGSRVADGIYETMLDGEELAELKYHERIRIRHYLVVDDHFTWWECGRSYLCRIVDMLHMGLLDEVLFGREVLTRWPAIVRSWPKARGKAHPTR